MVTCETWTLKIGSKFNKLTSIFYVSVLLLIIVNKITDALKTDINLVFYDNRLSNFPLSPADASHEFQIHVSVRILTIKFSQWTHMNFYSYRKNMYCDLTGKLCVLENSCLWEVAPTRDYEITILTPSQFNYCTQCTWQTTLSRYQG